MATSFTCEINIIQARNVEFIKSSSHGNFFVRYYLSAGSNGRIQLSSKEISSKFQPYWNESFSLECLGCEDSINALKQESVVFELRWRSTNPILGKIGGSQLVGRAEIPWKMVMESPKMEMEKWVVMGSKKSSVADGVKPPSVQIGMRVGVPVAVEVEEKMRKRRVKKWDDGCGCCSDGGYCRCEDYDVFALAAALEAL